MLLARLPSIGRVIAQLGRVTRNDWGGASSTPSTHDQFEDARSVRLGPRDAEVQLARRSAPATAKPSNPKTAPLDSRRSVLVHIHEALAPEARGPSRHSFDERSRGD